MSAGNLLPTGFSVTPPVTEAHSVDKPHHTIYIYQLVLVFGE